jgi:hypothetical protein
MPPQNLNEPAASQWELPRKWSDTGYTETMGSTGIPQADSKRQGDTTVSLCQKKRRAVKIK